MNEKRVNIVLADRGWILEKIGLALSDRLGYVSIREEPSTQASFNYYMNYSAFRGRGPTRDMAFFTHVEEAVPEAAERFYDVAEQVEQRVCMSRLYARRLEERGLDNVHLIRPGVDLEEFTPRLRIGLSGRTYGTGRKGEALVACLASVPFLEWHATGTGWPVPCKMHAPGEMASFYRSIDYLLVPSRYEGGPMPALEAIACGKPVITPDVGFMAELPHISYRNSDPQDLLRVLEGLHQKQLDLRESVLDSTWDAFAEKHDRLFRRLIPEIRSLSQIQKASPGAEKPASATPVSDLSAATRSALACCAGRTAGNSPGPLRILLADRKRVHKGGPAYRVPRTAEALRLLGHEVQVTGENRPDARAYDVVHVFNVWPPEEAGAQLAHLRSQGPALVFSPIFMDLFEHFVARDILLNIFSNGFSDRLRHRTLEALPRTLLHRVSALKKAGRHPLPGYPEALRYSLSLCDGVVLLGDGELAGIRELAPTVPPAYKIHNAPVADPASASELPEGLSPGGYVVCAGRLEPRKNQLFLIEALRDTGVPLVLAGSEPEQDYASICHKRAEGQPVFFLPHQAHEDGSYQALLRYAAAFILPSWVEGAPLAALEAGSLGTRLVLSDRGCVREYFGPRARYCNPASIAEIRREVLSAWEEYRQIKGPDECLASHVGQSFTWERVARETEVVYRDCLARRAGGQRKRTSVSVPAYADQPPYPIPCPDPAPRRWTEKARELWPEYLEGRLEPAELLELARIWMAMRQPGAALDLLDRHGEAMPGLTGVLQQELAAFRLDVAARTLEEDFRQAVGRLRGTNFQMCENERFHLWCCLRQLEKPAVVVELGSFHGGSTTLIAEYLRRADSDAIFLSLDIAKPRAYWDALRSTGLEGRVHHMTHYSAEAGAQLAVRGAQGTIDLLLVDADHRFAPVYKDLAEWMPLLKPGGVVVLHDYPGSPDPSIVGRYAHTLGVGYAADAFFEMNADFRRLFFPLLNAREPVWPGYPSIFSSLAAWRSTQVTREESKSRKSRFLLALYKIQQMLGNMGGARSALRDLQTADPLVAKEAEGELEALQSQPRTSTFERVPDSEATHSQESGRSSKVPLQDVSVAGEPDRRDPSPSASSYPTSASKLPPALAPASVRWVSSLFAYNGYAWLSRQLVPWLVRKGVAIQVQSYREDTKYLRDLSQNAEALWFWNKCVENRVRPDVHVCTHIPILGGEDVYASFRRVHGACKAHVGLTMFETDRLPDGWADACNRMDEIWVPSRFNLDSFAQFGVDPAKLHVIPFGIDSSFYGKGSVEAMSIPNQRGFSFLSVFQWYKRKGWDILLRAYLETFTRKEDVCLLLRAYPSQSTNPSIEVQLQRYIWKLGYDPAKIPPIVLLNAFIPEQGMPSLYASADAFVLPTHGEGWGIPFMEAMATGLPVIATAWSGHMDFMNQQNSYLIEVKGLVPVDPEQCQENPVYSPDHRWAAPSLEHTKALMRHVYEHREEARQKGVQARMDIRKDWTLERTADWVIDRLIALMERRRTSKPAVPSPPSSVQRLEPNALNQESNNRIAAAKRPRHPTPAPPPFFLWAAPFLNQDTCGREARSLAFALERQGASVKAKPVLQSAPASEIDEFEKRTLDRLIRRPSQTPFVYVQQGPPSFFSATRAALANIGRTLSHTDRIPGDWADKCNEMDEIWVPSRFTQETFRASGVNPEKVHIIPAPVSVHPFSDPMEPLPLPGRRGFNFLSVFPPIPRKGWDLLIAAYAKAFKTGEDVCLYLKLLGDSETLRRQGADQLLAYVREVLRLDPDRIPEMVVITEDIPPDAMPALYASVDAFVLPSRGEGWGHAYAEAMASGLPVIGTGWGGNTDYMSDDNAYLIEYDLVEAPQALVPGQGLLHKHRWAEPSIVHLQKTLRAVFENREEARGKGQRAREIMREKFSPEQVVQQIVERVQCLLGHRTMESRSEVSREKKACAGHRP